MIIKQGTKPNAPTLRVAIYDDWYVGNEPAYGFFIVLDMENTWIDYQIVKKSHFDNAERVNKHAQDYLNYWIEQIADNKNHWA